MCLWLQGLLWWIYFFTLQAWLPFDLAVKLNHTLLSVFLHIASQVWVKLSDCWTHWLSVFKSQMSTSNRGMFTAHYKKHYVDSEKKQYFHFVWLGAEGERHRHGEKTWRRETRHIDLKGFSPYIAVRSTLQPPLEREHVVNTSSSGQSLLSDFTLTGCIRACNQKLRRCFKNVNECWKNPRQFFQFISFFWSIANPTLWE